MTDEQKALSQKAKREYHKEWRARNRDKIRIYNERLHLLTRIMRGEVLRTEIVEGEPVEIRPTIALSIRACELLMKTLGALVDRADNTESLEKLDAVLAALDCQANEA